MFETRRTSELIQIAAAGGGFELAAASRSIQDLIEIAAAGAGKANIVFTGLQARSTADLVLIAAAGRGSVSFR